MSILNSGWELWNTPDGARLVLRQEEETVYLKITEEEKEIIEEGIKIKAVEIPF